MEYFFSNEVALVALAAFVNQNILWAINRVLTHYRGGKRPRLWVHIFFVSKVVVFDWERNQDGVVRVGVSKFAQQKFYHPLSSISFSLKSLWLLDIIFSPSYIGVYFSSRCEVGQMALYCNLYRIHIFTPSRLRVQSEFLSIYTSMNTPGFNVL